jgi:hypothetical protein
MEGQTIFWVALTVLVAAALAYRARTRKVIRIAGCAHEAFIAWKERTLVYENARGYFVSIYKMDELIVADESQGDCVTRIANPDERREWMNIFGAKAS